VFLSFFFRLYFVVCDRQVKARVKRRCTQIYTDEHR
jgi:hypothetical protein